ncbi:glycosyltransferase family 2 protein [Mariniflexile maritimum]|uniref:glycosyltransferase family 2 protein n=1 Tax=Mariniflexile maritimum TaxID=2682493 RepID=UPI0012F70767|nr:glycosyltransferase family 2 protein [Mariniflexile maritimum]
MQQLQPIVSIIMATYNRAHFIFETLQSIQAQSYKNWECLIIDDGSTDNTLTVITAFLKKDSRFQYYKRPTNYKKGLPGCRNYGLDLASGDYIIFFDDDDIVHPLCLENCLLAFNTYNEATFCNYMKQPFSGKFDYNLIATNKEYSIEITNDDLLENVLTQSIPFASCTVLWKRICFKEHVFNEDLMYAEEWECYQRILSSKPKGIIIDNVLYYNRKHPNSNTGEFWKGDAVRVASQKKAIFLVIENLHKKDLLTPYLFKYLVNYAISFRDFKLLKNILNITKPTLKLKLFYILKYQLFPLWVLYNNIFKYKHL